VTSEGEGRRGFRDRATGDLAAEPITGSMATDLPTIAKELRSLDKRAIRDWLRRGELLTLARELTATDANFRGWLRKLALPKTTAYKAMAAWRDFGKCPVAGHFTIEAMAILAPSPEAQAEAIGVADKHRVTPRVARTIVARHMTAREQATPTLTDHATAPFEEILAVEGGVVIIRGKGFHTPSDLLGMMMHAQRQLRERMTKASAA
jgi:hypothetical protein